jgi:hypothetical protein
LKNESVSVQNWPILLGFSQSILKLLLATHLDAQARFVDEPDRTLVFDSGQEVTQAWQFHLNRGPQRAVITLHQVFQ